MSFIQSSWLTCPWGGGGSLGVSAGLSCGLRERSGGERECDGGTIERVASAQGPRNPFRKAVFFFRWKGRRGTHAGFFRRVGVFSWRAGGSQGQVIGAATAERVPGRGTLVSFTPPPLFSRHMCQPQPRRVRIAGGRNGGGTTCPSALPASSFVFDAPPPVCV